ncbi:hypothetical protein BSM4216_3686 [Bacillus smithii]|jgi:hypothetical protein|nr:hypothetical protein BSM4216_3686 [Bacillus smithii]
MNDIASIFLQLLCPEKDLLSGAGKMDGAASWTCMTAVRGIKGSLPFAIVFYLFRSDFVSKTQNRFLREMIRKSLWKS